jgi:hypothetical protein
MPDVSLLGRASLRAACVALIAGLTAACGGDGSSTEPTPVPDVFSGQVSASQTAGIYVADSTVVSIVVTNQNGQPAAGRAVVFAVTAGSASLSGGPTWTTDGNGRASTTVRADAAGSVTVAGYLGTTASGTAQGSVGLSFIPDEVSGELSVSDEGDLRMSVRPIVTVTLTNQNGDPVEGQTVTFDIEAGTASATIDGDAEQSTDAEGKASVLVFPNFPGSVTVRAFFGAGTEGEAIGEAPVRWVTGPPVELYFERQPWLTLPGAEFLVAPIVVALDSDGWYVRNVDIDIQIEVEGGVNLRGTTTRRLIDGRAEFSGLSVDVAKAGMRFLASSPGLAGARSGRFTSMYRESFSLGGATTCMPDVSGVVYCWGANMTGQGGLSAADSLFAPVAIGGSPEGYKSVKTATSHTCALTRATSQAWCWGYSAYLGYDGVAANEPRGTPLPVTGGGSYDWLGVGGSGSCGRLGAGFFEDATVCWGANIYGQLGNGDIRDRIREISVVQLSGDPFTSIAKSAYTSCGVTESHDLYCWGRRAYGAVGDGIIDANQLQLSPIEVGIGKEWREVSGMGNTFCATTTSGEIYCWGENQAGLAGQAGGGVIAEPTKISRDEHWVAVDVGGLSACGVTAYGDMYCWGAATQGGLDVGNGFYRINFASRLLSNFGVGYGYACLVDEQGTPYCWGAFRGAGRQGHSQDGYAPVDGNLRIVTEPS